MLPITEVEGFMFGTTAEEEDGAKNEEAEDSEDFN